MTQTTAEWTLDFELKDAEREAALQREHACLLCMALGAADQVSGPDQARQRAAKETETVDVYRESVTVLEAKKVQHSLDEISDKDTPGWFPSQQVQDYLRNAKDKTGQRYFNWAILTNGNEWRLYCEQAPNDAKAKINGNELTEDRERSHNKACRIAVAFNCFLCLVVVIEA